MHLSSLAVSHYRGFESAQIDLPASGVALVVGPNNAGKSALLAALDVVSNTKPGERMAREASSELPRIEAAFTLTESEREALIDDQAGPPQDPAASKRWPAPWFQDWRLTFEAVSEDRAFLSKLEVRRGDEPENWALLAQQHFDGNFSMERLNFSTLLGSNPPDASWVLQDTGSRSSSPGDPVHETSATAFAARLEDWRRGYYHFEALRSAAPREVTVSGSEFLTPNGSDLPQALLHLFTNRDPAWEEIVSAMKELVPDVGELATPVTGGTVQVVFVDPYTNARRNVKDLGTGVEQLLMTVYVGVRGERTRFVTIEEPETNLHPAAQRALMRYLRDWSSDRVFLLATHSTVFLDEEFGQEAIYLVDRRDGVSAVQVAASDFRDVLTSLGVSLSDVMSAEKIVLVEGGSDAEILRTWFPAVAVSRGVAIADMGGSDRAWHVEILLRALDEIDQFGRSVLVIRDRDELSADAIGRLEAKEVVRLLSRRELENFLLDHGAVYEALCARADEISSSTQTPGSRQEVADRMKEAADSLRPVIVLKRVVANLPAPRLVDRSDVNRLRETANPLDGLIELVASRAKSADELEQFIREEWADGERGIADDWERRWPIIAPGADVLALVWADYGAKFDKTRDGVLVAQYMSPPDEIKDVLRQFVGGNLVP